MVGHYIGKRDISNHCPIWLKVNKEDWGAKPFKSNDSWFINKAFLKFMEVEWKNLIVKGMSDFLIKEKFKLLKDRLKKWNKKVFGWHNLKVEEGVEDINVMDKLLSRCVNEEVKDLVSSRNNDISYVWRHLSIRDNILIQKSRLK